MRFIVRANLHDHEGQRNMLQNPKITYDRPFEPMINRKTIVPPVYPTEFLYGNFFHENCFWLRQTSHKKILHLIVQKQADSLKSLYNLTTC